MRSLLPMFDDFFMDDGWDSFFDNAPAMRNRISGCLLVVDENSIFFRHRAEITSQYCSYFTGINIGGFHEDQPKLCH